MKVKSLIEVTLGDDGLPANLTPEKAVKVLEKTRKSISNHVMRGGSSTGMRGFDLRCRYDDHRSWLRNKSPKHWEEYCNRTGAHPEHDAHDLFA